MAARNIQLSFFFGIFGLAAILGFFILRPYINVLILALTAAVIFGPLYRAIAGKKRGLANDSIAAIITITAILVIVLIPLTFLGAQVVIEAQGVYANIQEAAANETSILTKIPEFENPVLAEAQQNVRAWLTRIGSDPSAISDGIFDWIQENFGSLFSSLAAIAGTLVKSFIWLFSLFYFFKDGKRIQKILVTASPLEDKYDNEIIARLSRAVKSVIGGTLVVALLQGILTGVGFWIFGVPLPAIWGSVAVVTALIPTVGTAVVNVPGIIYLFVTGNIGAAIVLVVWAFGFVGLVDNFLRPFILEKGVQIHPLVILLAVLGRNLALWPNRLHHRPTRDGPHLRVHQHLSPACPSPEGQSLVYVGRVGFRS